MCLLYRFVFIRMWAKAIIDLTGYYIRCRQTQRTFQWNLLQHMKRLKTWTAAMIQRRKTAITSPIKHLTKWNLKILHLTRRKNFPQAPLMASSFFSHLLHGPGKGSLVCVGETSGVFLLKILATTWHTISWTIYGFYLFLLSFRFWCEYFWTFFKKFMFDCPLSPQTWFTDFHLNICRIDSADLNFCVLWTFVSVIFTSVLNVIGCCPIELLGKFKIKTAELVPWS